LYAEELSSVEGITLHPEMPWAKCVYWLYSVLINEKRIGITKNKLAEKLQNYGIETRNFFYPLHKMPPYQKYAKPPYPVSSVISKKGLSLPSSVRLNEEDINYITQKIKEALSSNA
jgi:perosamine synthetase